MRVGIFQCEGGDHTPEQRFEKLTAHLKDLSLDLMVCPELFISGYNVGDKLIERAEEKDGRWSKRFAALAKETNTAFIYGYPEQAADQIYNSALCVNASGEIVANHRKLMLPPGFEADYFVAGDQTTLFELGGVHFAILICYDVEYPESVRHLAQCGAQVVIVPTALGGSWGVVSEKLVPARAFENGVWMVYANHTGEENGHSYFGGSCIANPKGEDAARAGSKECVISATIDIEAVKGAQDQLLYLEGSSQLLEKLQKADH
ncbi:MAG: carbon-nitrogen hydrolase family protein [Granulosicoccus sp.]|nr:carbon-nitrogen hydrolase family protein [Granulosicoccus sp.]